MYFDSQEGGCVFLWKLVFICKAVWCKKLKARIWSQMVMSEHK
jgi:hypothetical protein